MAIFELHSERERKNEKAGKEDVFQYDDFPERFRVQVAQILTDALGDWREPHIYGSALDYLSNRLWLQVFETITREKGQFRLSNKRGNPKNQCIDFLLTESTEDALDLIHVAFVTVDKVLRNISDYMRQQSDLITADAAIHELNHRFRQHGIGYQFEAGEIIRVDSTYIHAEAVKPAIELLHGAGKQFTGPLQEFLEAHRKYRQGEEKDAIAWALKAFESTLKSICTVLKWAYDPSKDTARSLLDIVYANELVPPYMQTQLSAVRSVLESGIPTVRNKTSGHGQGPTPTTVPEHFARYALHLTAVNIVFLFDCLKAMK